MLASYHDTWFSGLTLAPLKLRLGKELYVHFFLFAAIKLPGQRHYFLQVC